MLLRTATFTMIIILTSCMPQISHPLVTREVVVPQPPEQAYARAMHALLAVHGKIAHADRQLGLIQATVQQDAVALNVTITPEGRGSRIVAQHQVAPTQLQYGPVTLAEDFLTAYQAQGGTP